MAATSLQETDASFKTTEQELEYVFSRAVNALLDRKAKAMEELRSKWKADRLEMKDQAAVTQSLVSSAKTCTALGRTVSSVGLPSHIFAKEQELERAVQEAGAEEGKPLQASPRYKVNKDLSVLMQYVQELGTVHSVRSQSREVKTAKPQSKQAKSVTSQSAFVPSRPSMTSPTILTLEFQLESGRCSAGCRLWEDGRTLTNTRRPQSGGTGQSGPRPFAFLGTCGSVDLAQPALHYWTVRFQVRGSGDRCEVGLASLQSLQTCGSGKRISDHDVQAATILVVGDRDIWRLEGKGWTKDADTPHPLVTRDTPYNCLEEQTPEEGFDMTMGFLYDNRQPQSPRVLVVEAKSCRLLGVRRLSPFPLLRPVLRVAPSHPNKLCYVSLEMKTGPGVLDDVRASRLQSLLGRMRS